MADLTINYKGQPIVELSDSGTKTLKTGGKYCEDDINVEYAKPAGGGGGGGVQPDWNQNDSTAADYVKNRPFYTGNPVETVLFEERTISFSKSGGTMYTAELLSTFSATVGETYKVYWDGTAYECVCGEFETVLLLGNLSIIGAGSDTGEPFIMNIINGEGIAIQTKDTSASHTISISGLVAEVVKIDKKYLPFLPKPSGESYLTFSSRNSFTLSIESNEKTWNGTLEYFTSDETWTIWDGVSVLLAEPNGSEYVLYLRGTGNTVITGSGSSSKWQLVGSDIACIGNIENLLDYATVGSGEHPVMGDWCYSNMFRDCIGLTQAPALPATTLTDECYAHMFDYCISLTQAPALPATTLAPWCYEYMFNSCRSLTHPPELPATTVPQGCYRSMFWGCTSLVQLPVLPATELSNYCYNSMFERCSSIKLSDTKTGEYTQEYRIPISGDGTAAESNLIDMFTSTGGTFTGTPAINTTYYLSSENMIARGTKLAALNGYVKSMIDTDVVIPTTLPNPNAITFTGAVTGTYDGSAPLSVEIPSGGGGGSDISLGLTGAAVGQIAKITAVDDSGKPTAWSPVDMPSGGGGETWEAINAITLSDAVNTVTINTDSGGNAIALKKVRILVEGSATHNQDLFLNNSRYMRATAVGTAASVGALSAEPFCGKMYCFAVTNITANYGFSNQTANTFSDEITITEIKLIVNNSGTFSAGTKFTIQGVRA